MSAFPGAEIVDVGRADLAVGSLTLEALVVLVALGRLESARVAIPTTVRVDDPEGALYRRLNETDLATAHGRYLSLLRQLDSYARCAEAAASRATRLGSAGSPGAISPPSGRACECGPR